MPTQLDATKDRENGHIVNTESAEIETIENNPLMFDESAWIESDAAIASANSLTRLEIQFNTVTWQSGKSGKVQVTRLIPATLQSINIQHEHTRINGKPVTLTSAYVAKYQTVYNGEKIGRVLGVVATDENGKAYLLTSSYNFAVQSNGGENFTTLQNMIATVKKAKALAETYGIADENNFVYDNTETVIRTRPIVAQENSGI